MSDLSAREFTTQPLTKVSFDSSTRFQSYKQFSIKPADRFDRSPMNCQADRYAQAARQCRDAVVRQWWHHKSSQLLTAGAASRSILCSSKCESERNAPLVFVATTALLPDCALFCSEKNKHDRITLVINSGTSRAHPHHKGGGSVAGMKYRGAIEYREIVVLRIKQCGNCVCCTACDLAVFCCVSPVVCAVRERRERG
jgi:hypothetical protein